MKRPHILTLIGTLVLSGTAAVFAALLGINPSANPLITFTPAASPSNNVRYTLASGQFAVDATPSTLALNVPSGTFGVTNSPTVKIRIILDNTGALVGGVAADDLIVTGDVDTNGDTIPDYTGTLLTGEILAFGFQDSGSNIDFFDFRFKVTGGALASLFPGDIGISMTAENSNFVGTWTAGWNADRAKGKIGPIPSNRSCDAKIGDFVWHDTDRDGLQDSGEPGINGVTVKLKTPGGIVLATTVTAAGPMGQNGYYQFDHLCADTYVVEVDTASLPPDYTPTPTNVGSDTTIDSNTNPSTVVLTTDNSSDQTIDFGYQSPCSGELGDFVWNDLNRDGIQDAGEPGIGGVKVWLEDGAGNPLAFTTTDGSGKYEFKGLCPGDYRVRVDLTTLPAGFTPSPTNQGGDDLIDSNPNPTIVTLDEGEVDDSIDFGYNKPCTGMIGDFVWHDLNRDGIQDAGEPGINGVNVILKDTFGNVIATTQTITKPSTTEHGYYEFSGLCAGTYVVLVDLTSVPAGFVPSPTLQGGDTTIDSNTNPTPVVLPDDFATDVTIDFGFNVPCSGVIGDFVWEDLNRNGLQDAGEPGIDGLTVNLRKASDNSIIQTTTTGPSGFYQFTGLCAGDYKVEVATPPVGYVPTLPLVGPDRSVDSANSPELVNLPSDNTSDLTIDFGYNKPCSGLIGDFVWNDADRDGIQDVGESGIPGVTVTLKDSGGNTIATTTTNGSGYYQFAPLCGGTYRVYVGTPAGYVPSPSNAGGDDAKDSDGSGVSVTLPNDFATDITIDFGFNTPCSGQIGDFVWNDLNGNGIQNTGEPGIGGVTVTLKIGSTVIATTTTNSSGYYLFSGLCGGNYTVVVNTPTGMLPSPSMATGSTTANDSNGSPAAVTLPNDNATNLTIDFGFYVPPCVPLTFVTTGGTASSGTPTVRTFTAGSTNVHVSGWGETKPGGIPNGVFSAAYLGAYSLGLGVTDSSEGDGSNDRHVVDNYDRNNYVMYEFQSPVIVDKIYLDYANTDSDITVWIGNVTNAYTTHQTLTSALLTSLGFTEVNTTTAAGARWADINAGGVSGNVLVVAAYTTQTNDGFKITKIQTACPAAPKPLALACPATSGTVGTPYSASLAATGGVSPYLYSLISGSLPSGLSLNTSSGLISGTPTIASSSSFTGKVVDSTSGTAQTATAACTITVQNKPCVVSSYGLTGSSASYGAAGNIRVFTVNGVSVKVSAFGQTKSTGTFSPAWLGSYSHGLGVTDSSEGDGSNNRHTVDNYDKNNYVLFEFQSPVVIDKLYLDYVSSDSDVTVWIGNVTNVYNNHQALTTSFLSSLGTPIVNTTSVAGARWADINSANKSGNVLVVAARTDETNDSFKLTSIVTSCPTVVSLAIPPSMPGMAPPAEEPLWRRGLSWVSAAVALTLWP